ncbi:MAG: hypothetical protein ABIJ56_22345 [Pseudomonadota bacterium]
MVKAIIPIFIVFTFCNGRETGPVLFEPGGKGDVVAEVDGIKIRRSLVQAAAAEAGMEPGEVLDRLIDDIVLADEAVRHGYIDSSRVEKAWKKVLVQKILEQQVEKEVPKESITLEDIQQYYVANYENRGRLLGEVWQEIRFKLLKERRDVVYRKLINTLEAKGAATFYPEKVDTL